MPSSQWLSSRRGVLAASTASLTAVAGCQAAGSLLSPGSGKRQYRRDAPIDAPDGTWPTTRGTAARRSYTDAAIGPGEDGSTEQIGPATTLIADPPVANATGIITLLDDVNADHLDDTSGQFTGTLNTTRGGIQNWTQPGSGSTVASAGNAAFVPLDSGIMAVDARTGEECWRFTEGKYPTIAGAIVCVEAGDRLYGLDSKTGNPVWEQENFADESSFEYTVDAFAATADLLVATRRFEYDAPSLVAFDPADGTVRWRGDIEPSPWTPVIGPDSVYALTGKRKLVAYTKAGAVKWSRRTLLAAPPAVGPERLYGIDTSRPGAVVALDAESGDEVWRTEVGENPAAVPAVTAEAVFTVVGGDGEPVRTVALEPETGTVSWTRRMTDESIDGLGGVSAPALTEDRLVFMATASDARPGVSGTYIG